MADRRDIVDIAGLPDQGSGRERTEGGRAGAGAGSRPWLGIMFRCCRVYSRIYRNAAGTAYHGRCPRCGAEISARVGAGGTNRRIFHTE